MPNESIFCVGVEMQIEVNDFIQDILRKKSMKHVEIGRGSHINFIDFQGDVIYMHIGYISTKGSKGGPMTIPKRRLTRASLLRETILENIFGFDDGIPSD